MIECTYYPDHVYYVEYISYDFIDEFDILVALNQKWVAFWMTKLSYWQLNFKQCFPLNNADIHTHYCITQTNHQNHFRNNWSELTGSLPKLQRI